MCRCFGNISGGAGMMNATAVKARLKNIAEQDGKPLQEKLINYGIERTIYRLSKSRFCDRFTLKGGMFMYALFDGEYSRATLDIDLHAQRIGNDDRSILKVFEEVFSMEADDAIIFDLNTLKVANIIELSKYHGVNVSIVGYLDRTKVPVSIDIAFGDVIHPDRMKIKFPSILDMDEFEVYAYSIYSAIAEKFETFVSNGLANSRYKDYYDICEYFSLYNLDGKILKAAIEETFQNRGTSFEDIVAFDIEYISDEVNQRRWNAFIKKKKAIAKLTFAETMELVVRTLKPVTEAILDKQEFDYSWDCDEMIWKH